MPLETHWKFQGHLFSIGIMANDKKKEKGILGPNYGTKEQKVEKGRGSDVIHWHGVFDIFI